MTTKPKITAAVRHRDFALLWGGQTISLIGNGMYTVTLPLEVLRLHGSPLDLALVVSARTVPMVLLLLAGGTIVDRLSRRLVMLVSDTSCGILVAAAAILIALGQIHIWELALLGAGFGFASAFFRPASTAIVPDIVAPEALMSASSLSTLSLHQSPGRAPASAGGPRLPRRVGRAWSHVRRQRRRRSGRLAVRQPLAPQTEGYLHLGVVGQRGGRRHRPWPGADAVDGADMRGRDVVLHHLRERRLVSAYAAGSPARHARARVRRGLGPVTGPCPARYGHRGRSRPPDWGTADVDHRRRSRRRRRRPG